MRNRSLTSGIEAWRMSIFAQRAAQTFKDLAITYPNAVESAELGLGYGFCLHFVPTESVSPWFEEVLHRGSPTTLLR